ENSLNDNSLLAYYSWDVNIKDDKDSHDGINYNATHITSGCKLDGCYSFNGFTDYIRLDLDKILNGWTVSFWIKLNNDLNSSDNYFSFFSSNIAGFHDGDFRIAFNRDSKGEIGIEIDDPDDYKQKRIYSDNGEWNSNTWYYLTVTSNGTYIQFYVNGIKQNSSNYGFISDQNLGINGSYTWYIGRDVQDNVYFNGSMDEVYISNRKLNQTEINILYNNGEGCNPINENCGAVNFSLFWNITDNQYYNFTDFCSSEYPFNCENFTYNIYGIMKNTGDLFNCSLFFNGILNQTYINLNLSQIQYLSFNIENWNKTININMTCENNNAYNSVFSENLTFYIVKPKAKFKLSSNISNLSYKECLPYNWTAKLEFNNVLPSNNTFFYDSSGNNNNAQCSDCPIYTDGKYETGLLFDGIDNVINISNDIINTGSDTVCAWIYLNSFGETGTGRLVDTGKFLFLPHDTNDNLYFNNNGNYIYSEYNSINLSTWQFVCIVRNFDGNSTFYINGNVSGIPNRATALPVDSGNAVSIGNNNANDRAYDGIIDNLFFAHEKFLDTEIYNIYKYTCPNIYDKIITNIYNYTDLYPDFRYYYKINASILEWTNELFTCNIYYNDILNHTYNNINLSKDNYLYINVENWEKNMTLTISCNNDEIENNVSYKMFFDVIQPEIQLYNPIENNNYFDTDLFVINFSVIDTNLAYVNFSITNLNENSEKYSYINENPEYWFNYSETIPINDFCSYNKCTMLLKINAYDDHNPTNKQHEKLKYLEDINENGYKGKKILFKKGYIELKGNEIKEIKLKDKDNKYLLDFDLNSVKEQKLIFKSSNKWKIAKNTKHKAHLYSIELKKYFDLDNAELKSYKLNKISDYEYEINFIPKKTKLNTHS
ncbi:hypothetical protein DRO03_12115, partial [Methanosarcinales archaeon]